MNEKYHEQWQEAKRRWPEEVVFIQRGWGGDYITFEGDIPTTGAEELEEDGSWVVTQNQEDPYHGSFEAAVEAMLFDGKTIIIVRHDAPNWRITRG